MPSAKAAVVVDNLLNMTIIVNELACHHLRFSKTPSLNRVPPTRDSTGP